MPNKKKADGCTNEKCGFDKSGKRVKPVYVRKPVKPSDMLCPQCEGRLVETTVDDDVDLMD